jgi:hypothetical protein
MISRHRGKDNIKMTLGEIGREDMHWIYIVQYRVLNTVVSFLVS